MAESDKIKSSDIIQEDIFQNTIDSGKELVKVLDSLQKEFTEVADAQAKIAKKSAKNLNTADDIKRTTTALNESQKARKRANDTAKEKIKLEEKLKRLNSTAIDQNTELKVLIQEQNKVNKQLAREKLGLVGAYEREAKQLAKLRKRYKDTALTLGENSKEAKKLEARVVALDNKLKRVDAAAGQFQRNVGNYPKTFREATRALAGFGKQLIGAFGVVGGITLFAGALRDAFTRIREFDKEIVGLSAILGVNRNEIAGLEQTIIDVAGSSIKTSNEVAKLATTLITLGKSTKEVEILLKPVNDLSIALGATSDEAGELLVSNLNAFGASTLEAQKYADIIAKVRTSTALDFQRIKDALGFLAPTANAAGISFEETGALLGVLVDNGVKAARAGRLLSTSFLKLAADGKTLEDGLDEINEAQDKGISRTELLKLASESFGKEAAGLALILANNRDRVDELTKSFEDAGGSLDDLTNKQLESLDAKLKILDSTYERLLINIENGEGVLSSAFVGFIERITTVIDLIDRFSTGDILTKFKIAVNQYVKSFVLLISPLVELINKFTDLDINLDELVFKLDDVKKATADYSEELKINTNETDANNDSTKKATGFKFEYVKWIKILTESYKELNEQLQISFGILSEIPDLDLPDLTLDEEEVEENIKTVSELYKEGLKEIELAGLESGSSQEAILEKQLKQTEDFLQKQIEFRKGFGEDTIDLELKLAETRKIIAEKELADERAIQDARIESLRGLADLTETIAGDNEEAQKAALVAKKAVATSEILINLQREISDIRARNADKENEGVLNSSQIAGATVTALAGIATINAQGSFYEGTEMVERDLKGAKIHSGRDGYNINVDGSERILTGSQNAKIGDISNEHLADIAMLYNRGQLVNPMTDLGINITNTEKQTDKTHLLIREISQLRSDINNKPVQQVNVDSFGNLVEVVYRNGVKDTTKYKGKDWI